MGAPGDRFEREADEVADQVLQRMESGNIHRTSPPAVQTKCTVCRGENEKLRWQVEQDRENQMLQAKADTSAEAAPNTVQHALERGEISGEALNSSLRGEMEHAFQADFSGVRIHKRNAAESLNRELNARAFTHGRDIFFNTGEFQPETRDGRHLLAHELTHVRQQSGRVYGAYQLA